MPLKDPAKRRAYHAEYMKKVWYPKNKKKHIGYVKRLKEEIVTYIREQKMLGNCADCGFSGKKHPQVLEYDHVTGNKKFEIGVWRQSALSITTIKDEIKKCELVCANCHRIRTFSKIKHEN